LQRLVEQLAVQLELTFRHDLPEHERRFQRMAEAIAAWNSSPRSDLDFVLMANWLRQAIQASTPGATQPLPGLPIFMSQSRNDAQRAPIDSNDSNFESPPEHLPAPSVKRVSSTERSLLDQTEALPPNPFVDDPLPMDTSLARRSEAAEAASREKLSSHSEFDRDFARHGLLVNVNLPFLSALIEIYNRGLEKVERTLIKSPDMVPRELAESANMLVHLLEQHDFITLYLRTLNPIERDAIPDVRKAGPAVRVLADRIVAQRKRMSVRGGTHQDDRLLDHAVRQLAILEAKS
jgi:hypothetical protein